MGLFRKKQDEYKKAAVIRKNKGLLANLRKRWKMTPRWLRILISSVVILIVVLGSLYLGLQLYLSHLTKVFPPTTSIPEVYSTTVFSDEDLGHYYMGQQFTYYIVHTDDDNMIVKLKKDTPYILDVWKYNDVICDYKEGWGLFYSIPYKLYYLAQISPSGTIESKIQIANSTYSPQLCSLGVLNGYVAVITPDGIVSVDEQKKEIVYSVRYSDLHINPSQEKIYFTVGNVAYGTPYSFILQPHQFNAGVGLPLPFDPETIVGWSYDGKPLIKTDEGIAIADLSNIIQVNTSSTATVMQASSTAATATNNKVQLTILYPYYSGAFAVSATDIVINNFSVKHGFFSDHFYYAESFSNGFLVTAYKEETSTAPVSSLLDQYKAEPQLAFELRDPQTLKVEKVLHAVTSMKPVEVQYFPPSLIVFKDRTGKYGFYNFEKSLKGEVLEIEGYDFYYKDPYLFVLRNNNITIFKYKDTGLPEPIISLDVKGVGEGTYIDFVDFVKDNNNTPYLVAKIRQLNAGTILTIINLHDPKQIRYVTGMNAICESEKGYKDKCVVFGTKAYHILNIPQMSGGNVAVVKGVIYGTQEVYKDKDGAYIVGPTVVKKTVAKWILTDDQMIQNLIKVVKMGHLIYYFAPDKLYIYLYQDFMHYGLIGVYNFDVDLSALKVGANSLVVKDKQWPFYYIYQYSFKQ